MALSGLTKDEIWLLAYNLQSLEMYLDDNFQGLISFLHRRGENGKHEERAEQMIADVRRLRLAIEKTYQYSPSTAAADTGDSNSAAKDQRS